ncbi:uncharacterized protein [Montipora capricornis]|uniref:uncharacterized protein n=1 Tax=Montipora capricornis TaxID=246305 RepID=UPI0035F1D7FE
MTNWKQTLRFFAAVNIIALVHGHGMMLDPASRNSAWRFFPGRPAQYTDNELNCGGFSVQWDTNNGKCGVCGDAYNAKEPRYVFPGKYAKDGFITKMYKKGETIKVLIKITSNHQGFFRFSLGKVMRRPITQDQLTHVLLQPDGSNTWQLHSSGNGQFEIDLVLPKDLTCSHCVLQWWWTVGNNWGCDDNGLCGIGKGKKQETFVNCADISITSTGAPVATTKSPGTNTNPTQKASTQATKPPPSSKAPSGGCQATEAYKNQPGMDKWCTSNCAAGYCPSSHCVCN